MANNLGSQWSQSWRREGYDGKDLSKRKVLSLEWKREGGMEEESGKLIEEVPGADFEGAEPATAPHWATDRRRHVTVLLISDNGTVL